MDTINQQITAYSKELRLPVFRRDYKELATEAAKGRLDYETNVPVKAHGTGV